MFKKILYGITAIALLVAVYVPTTLALDSWYYGTENQRNIQTTYVEGGTGLDYTLTPIGPFRLLSMMFNVESDPGSEVITISLVSVEGSTWNTVLNSQNLNTITDYVKDFSDTEMFFESGDAINLQWANAGTLNYGIILKYELK